MFVDILHFYYFAVRPRTKLTPLQIPRNRRNSTLKTVGAPHLQRRMFEWWLRIHSCHDARRILRSRGWCFVAVVKVNPTSPHTDVVLSLIRIYMVLHVDS